MIMIMISHHHQTPSLPKLNPMLISTLQLFSFLCLLLSTTIIAAAVDDSGAWLPYTPTDHILLDCGSASNTTDVSIRNWDGDVRSQFLPSNNENTSSNATSSESVIQVPYKTARIFHSQFTYSFPVSAGPKFIRLYFYPVNYSDLDITNSFFSLTSSDYTLLNNFSAFLTVSAMKPAVASLIKEFIVNVRDNQILNITFWPSPNSYAFVNGIEVVSMPKNLHIRGNDHPIPLVSENQRFYIDNNSDLETLYRLNVGGNEETPPYTAPKIVYTTTKNMGNDSLRYNLTWRFPVDSGFYYLLRLHFCEIQLEVTLENQGVFIIYINNQTAERGADVIYWSGGTGIPVFKDYVIMVTDPDGRRSKQDLWLAMYPELDNRPDYGDAILNGLEIFKLSETAGVKKHNNKTSSFSAIIGSVLGGRSVLVLILVS
ncbi:unnamed protein product [Ilex paraguariensis]|uniref:Malectin-like domain-containing protein n=1 Tax=Ilex paraguariensis TaxID=185542 RepID=A0ABC8R175_9AQUA